MEDIASQFCGQTQPHVAHWWQTPPTYGATTLIEHKQCAGIAPAVLGGGDEQTGEQR